jgi:hypothetical protein
VKWTLYYEPLPDGTIPTFSSEDGQPWESPPWGVVAVGQDSMPVFKDRLLAGPVFLYREDWDCWMETADPDDQLSAYCNVVSAYRKGRHIRNDWWKNVTKRVVSDLDG